jgi:crotonobetainyl-CoA:carnitine CoA-transferase CaiB-like acyl-CoA transferase
MSWLAGHSSANAPMNSTVWSNNSESCSIVAPALSLPDRPPLVDRPLLRAASSRAAAAPALSHSLAKRTARHSNAQNIRRLKTRGVLIYQAVQTIRRFKISGDPKHQAVQTMR